MSVTRIFVEHHGKISHLIDGIRKGNNVKNCLQDLKGMLKMHFHQEEILYSMYKYKTGEILPILQTIRNDHKRFNDMLDGIESIDTEELIAGLEKHKNMEERLLYPEFEKILPDEEKEEFEWKLKNFIGIEK